MVFRVEEIHQIRPLEHPCFMWVRRPFQASKANCRCPDCNVYFGGIVLSFCLFCVTQRSAVSTATLGMTGAFVVSSENRECWEANTPFRLQFENEPDVSLFNRANMKFFFDEGDDDCLLPLCVLLVSGCDVSHEVSQTRALLTFSVKSVRGAWVRRQISSV